MDDLCRGRKVASDARFNGTPDISEALKPLRVPLTSIECRKLRELGPILAHTVEATCRNCEPGQSECEIAGEVAHRLIRHQIYPERIQVCADGRAATYPHWTFGSEPVQHRSPSRLSADGPACVWAFRGRSRSARLPPSCRTITTRPF